MRSAVLSCPRLPRHRLPRHGRLFLLGLAGGVSGGNGDFRTWTLIGAHVYVSEPVQVAERSVALPLLTPLSPISGRPDHRMVDCRWERKGLGIRDLGLEEGSKSKFKVRTFPLLPGEGPGVKAANPIPNPQSHVSLGDKSASVPA